MNVKVEAYLAEKEREIFAAKDAYRKKILRNAGLVENIYSGNAQASEEFPHYDYDEMSLFGLLVAGIGSLVSWLSGLFTYGFGELIVKTDEIAANTRKKDAA